MRKTREVTQIETYDVCDICFKEFGSAGDPLQFDKIKTNKYYLHSNCIDELVGRSK